MKKQDDKYALKELTPMNKIRETDSALTRND